MDLEMTLIMNQPYQCEASVEITGQSVLSLFQNLNYQNVAPVLRRHGLDAVEPQSWYPLQSMLNILRDIASNDSGMMDLVGIGLSAAELGYVPPEMEHLNLDQVLESYGRMYTLRHRNGNAGAVAAERVSEKHIKMILTIPYPDDLFYGVFYGYCRRFLPKGTPFTVEYDSLELRRSQGGSRTVIHVYWE